MIDEREDCLSCVNRQFDNRDKNSHSTYRGQRLDTEVTQQIRITVPCPKNI